MSTNLTIKMIIRENHTVPAGYVPQEFHVNSAVPEAPCQVTGQAFNHHFPGMTYAIVENYDKDERKVFDHTATTGQNAFENDYRSLPALEQYYYAKFCQAYIADNFAKHQAQEEEKLKEAAAHQEALKTLELFEEAIGTKRLSDHLAGKDTPTPSPMYAYKDLDGNTILSDLKGQRNEISLSGHFRRCVNKQQWQQMSKVGNISFDITKLVETLHKTRREQKRQSAEEAAKSKFVGAAILHQIEHHPCFTNQAMFERLLSFHFIAGDMSHLSYLHFHPQGAAAFRIGEVYNHVEALRIMGTFLYVAYGEPWKNLFAPLIERIQHGDLNSLVSTTATKTEHTLLVDFITDALIKASAIVRSEEPRICDYGDAIPKNTPQGLVADIAQVLEAIPCVADPITLSNRLVLFQTQNDLQNLTDEIAKAQGKDRTTKRKATVSSEDGPRPKRDTTTTKSTVKAEKDLCLKSIFVQWRGPKIFNDKNTPGHQACLDPKKCTRIHQPFKQMAKSDLQAAFAQGPTIFGADNWEAKNYAERLLADNSNSKFSCPYFPDGTPRTSDKVAEIRAKRGLKTQASRKANGDN